MTGFVPWSVPAAVGVVLGVAAIRAAAPTGRGLVVALAVSIAVVALVAHLRAGAVRTRPGAARILLLTAIAAGGLAAGALRANAEASWRDPLAPIAGRTVELAGVSDGRFLAVDGVDARVALRPGGTVARGTVPRGVVRVRGRLRSAQPARTPGGFDERAWLRGRRATLVLEEATVTHARPEAGPRAAVRRGLDAGLGPDAATLLRAMVLGEREDARDLRDMFARAGLAHLLALSGLHLGVVVAAVGMLLAPLGRARGLVVAVVAASVPMLLGPSPSLVRAAIMAATTSLAVAAGTGRIGPVGTLALAAGVSLTVRPAWLGDLGFQLSYLSLAGILGLGAPWARRLASGGPPWRPRALFGGSLAVSVGAWLATLPVVATAFGTVAPAGPLVNVLAVPLAGVLVPAGALKGLVGAVWPAAGQALALAVGPMAEALLAVAGAGARLPQTPLPAIGGHGAVLFALGAAPWAWAARRAFAPRRAALVTAIAVACWAALPAAAPTPELVVLDVGQGDATLLRLPGRAEVLVDGGGTPFGSYDVGAEIVVPALRAMGVDALELVVATHADLDHAEGLVAVLRALPVGALAYGVDASGDPAWDRLAATARAEGVPLLPLRRGQRVRFGDATLHVLNPGARPSGDANDDSVVLRVDWRGRPWALLAGDVGRGVERTLAVPQLPLLLAPHHGSGASTSLELLRAARPEVVAISVGRNRYGHPSDAVLGRAADAGARVRRTDEDGTLRFRPPW